MVFDKRVPCHSTCSHSGEWLPSLFSGLNNVRMQVHSVRSLDVVVRVHLPIITIGLIKGQTCTLTCMTTCGREGKPIGIRTDRGHCSPIIPIWPVIGYMAGSSNCSSKVVLIPHQPTNHFATFVLVITGSSLWRLLTETRAKKGKGRKIVC